MPLSKHHLDTRPGAVQFDPEALGRDLAAACPEVLFALLLGSARDGCVGPRSDLDLAVYLADGSTLDLHCRLQDCVERHAPGVRADIGILNHAEPVYRFEALRGRLLFAREPEIWLRLFSVTCREYEHQLGHYERQRRYRLQGPATADRGERVSTADARR